MHSESLASNFSAEVVVRPFKSTQFIARSFIAGAVRNSARNVRTDAQQELIDTAMDCYEAVSPEFEREGAEITQVTEWIHSIISILVRSVSTEDRVQLRAA